MDDSEITALANGMVPFVRECVAQSINKVLVVSPALAEQVASAIRLLDELPPISERKRGRISRVERDEQGNFVMIYDEQP